MSQLLVDIINILARLALIVVGVLVFSGVVSRFDKDINTFVGGSLILFGTYRLVLYYVRRKNNEEQEDEQ